MCCTLECNIDIDAPKAVWSWFGCRCSEGYTIKVETDGAEFGREGEEAYIPFETSMDYDGRVELIDTCDNDAEYELAVQMMKELNAEQNCMVNV